MPSAVTPFQQHPGRVDDLLALYGVVEPECCGDDPGKVVSRHVLVRVFG